MVVDDRICGDRTLLHTLAQGGCKLREWDAFSVVLMQRQIQLQSNHRIHEKSRVEWNNDEGRIELWSCESVQQGLVNGPDQFSEIVLRFWEAHLGDCSMMKMSNAVPCVPRRIQSAVTVSMRRSWDSRPRYGTTTASRWVCLPPCSCCAATLDGIPKWPPTESRSPALPRNIFW